MGGLVENRYSAHPTVGVLDARPTVGSKDLDMLQIVAQTLGAKLIENIGRLNRAKPDGVPAPHHGLSHLPVVTAKDRLLVFEEALKDIFPIDVANHDARRGPPAKGAGVTHDHFSCPPRVQQVLNSFDLFLFDHVCVDPEVTGYHLIRRVHPFFFAVEEAGFKAVLPGAVLEDIGTEDQWAYGIE